MAILENALVVPGLFVIATQVVTYLLLKKSTQLKMIIIPNLSLFGLGFVISLVGYLLALGEPGSWAGLGFTILMIVTLIATAIRIGLSLVMFTFLKKR
ncbi:MAG: hypothetical protein ACO3H6_04205 [Bacilli bacterium]